MNPTSTTTFLFTDIEGSTRRWDSHPESMHPALLRHNAIVGNAIRSHGGTVFKTVGDAYCAAFAEPLAAVTAALDAQIRLNAEQWDSEIGPIMVRMAIHTGIAIKHGRDYLGPPLNRVARLLSTAHGQQLIISGSTEEHLVGRLPDGCSLEDKGLHRLKDLTLPEHVWQVNHSDLPHEFDPLASLQDFNNNLPTQETEFIGRGREMEDVASLLDGNSEKQIRPHRMLTLTGAGGCGKTRLAIQVAAERIERYPDGVWLVDLTSIADPSLIAHAAAKAMRIREEPGRDIIDTILDHLVKRNALLILDNCEQLVESAAVFADAIIRGCPKVSILATSREQLKVRGEKVWIVPPLPVPDEVSGGSETSDAEDLLECDSVMLYVERAQRIDPDFHFGYENAGAVANICRRLDGIPLAIELAAALSHVLTSVEISERLDERFRLLTEGGPVVPHHKTLRAVIDWSYDLLTETERRLFKRLGIFAGPWLIEAAESICIDPVGGEIDSRAVLPILARLVSKSLVVAETVRLGSENRKRYRLLETVRIYARERLTEEGVSDRASIDHAAYYCHMAEDAEPRLSGPRQAEWLDRLETEHENLRAVLSSEYRVPSSENVGGDHRLRLAGALWRFWHVRGYWSEGRRRLDAVLEALRRSTTGEKSGSFQNDVKRSWAKGLHGLGSIAYSQGDYSAAEQWLQESLTLWRQIGDDLGAAATLNNLGALARRHGDATLAQERFEESLAIRERSNDRAGIADSLFGLGNLAIDRGDYPEAQRVYARSLEIYRDLGHKSNAANALALLGVAAQELGNLHAAQEYEDEALALARELGDSRNIAGILNNQGNHARMRGDFDAARSKLEKSLSLFRTIGDQHSILGCLINLAVAALLRSDPDLEGARSYLKEALEIVQASKNGPGQVFTMEAVAALAALIGRSDDAGLLLGTASALRESLDLPVDAVDKPIIELAESRSNTALGKNRFVKLIGDGRLVGMEKALEIAAGLLST